MSGSGLALPLSAPWLVRSRRGRRIFERNVVYYRTQWMIIFTGFFEPLFYLLSVGYGVGELVGDVTVDGRLVEYTAYVAPGLLATSAMNGAIYDSTMNIFYKLKHARTYEAALAAPMTPADVANGEISWALFRGLLYAVSFLVVMAGLGLVSSWWAVLAPLAAVLIGYGFAAVGMAVTTYARTWADFAWVNVATTPLFLFSATFYPLDTYPRWLQIVVQCFPLYHGVELLRGLTSGTIVWGLLGHGAYFAAMGLIAQPILARRLRHLLLS